MEVENHHIIEKKVVNVKVVKRKVVKEKAVNVKVVKKKVVEEKVVNVKVVKRKVVEKVDVLVVQDVQNLVKVVENIKNKNKNIIYIYNGRL